MNAGGDPVEFVFPEFLDLENWFGILTTAQEQGSLGQFHVGSKEQLQGHTLTVFEGRQ
jgi:hypothetical protein